MGQLVIDERQYEALKRQAKALGVSEDELVRRAIDAALVETPTVSPALDRSAKIAELLDAARVLAEGRAGGEPYRFRRDELYEAPEAGRTRTK